MLSEAKHKLIPFSVFSKYFSRFTSSFLLLVLNKVL